MIKNVMKLGPMRFLFFVILMTLISNTILGSNISQFGGGKPIRILDKCNKSFPGYSVGIDLDERLAWLKYFPSVISITGQLCNSSSTYYDYNGSTGTWSFAGAYGQSSCYSQSTFYCFYSNDNY